MAKIFLTLTFLFLLKEKGISKFIARCLAVRNILLESSVHFAYALRKSCSHKLYGCADMLTNF